MAISRYRDPAGFFGLQRLNRILDEAFAGTFPEQGNVITSTLFAPTDVSEDDKSLTITMELPGVDPEDVRLSLENSVLTIRGEKKQQIDESQERVHRFERVYGVFERTFALPNTVDPDKVDARFENGVLLISIPKAERARPREIRVKSSASSSAQVRSSSAGQSGSSTASRRGSTPNGQRDAEEEGSAAKAQR